MICLFRKWLVIALNGGSLSEEKLSFWEKNWQYITDSYLPCNILGIVSHGVFSEVFIYLFINKKVIQAVQCQIVKTILYTQYIHRIWVNFKQMSDLERTFGVENTQWMKIVSDRAFSIARTTDAQWSLFSLKCRTFGLGQTNWTDKFWGICKVRHLGYFRLTYQHPFWWQSLILVFFIIQSLFLQKSKPLYPHPKYLFRKGIESLVVISVL